jgi:hypothetical protein
VGCWVLTICLLVQPRCEAAQYVELTAEMEINDWNYWFVQDQRGFTNHTGEPVSIFTKAATVHCVVDTNAWLMEGDFYRNSNVTRWFTGTNITEHGVVTQELAATSTERLSQVVGIAARSPSIGQ